jgi:glyoxylase-like metal-dependent hydrolase (beta-lactamase superfamily II)
VELTPDCALVASGYLGFGLTDPWDAHAYLLRSGDEAMLIDTGCGRDSTAIARRIDVALDGRRLVAIALTHGHVDHSGGARELSERFGAPVYASALAAARLAFGDEDAVGLTAAREDGVYPPDQILRAVPGVRSIARLVVGSVVVEAVPAPGHSADHLAYLAWLPSGPALFSGDLVFAQGRIALLGTADADEAHYAASLRKVDEMDIEQLFPGHGAIVVGRGRDHIRAAVAAFDRGGRPMGLVA